MKRNNNREIATITVATPIGRLAIQASRGGIVAIDFATQGSGRNTPRGDAPPEVRRHLTEAMRQLRDYFAGRRTRFDLPLDLSGTPFQQRVWRVLKSIPFGQTLSYGEMAARLGREGGARAVGRACATNPVPIVVPCHRVVGSNGALRGYDGGLWRKQKLLELELNRG